jgi:nicotinamidase/pyrazinamidase
MTDALHIGPADVLLVVDVQNDFCAGGALAVPGGEQVAPVINRLAPSFEHVILTQDWHPRGHLSFASAHPGSQPYGVFQAPYGPQTLWPDHCVQGSRGAEFRSDLETARAELVLRKGFHPHIDSYSAFFENDRTTPTGLCGYLIERGFRRVFLAGLAFDFCVLWTARDARRVGIEPVVFEDACRGIDVDGSMAAARAELRDLGVACLPSIALSEADP